MFVILTVTDRKVSDERHKMASPARREYPERPLVGVGAVILSDAGVVLIKRAKPPRVGAWSLPGGAQKLGETVAEAAHREILEETGLVAEVIGLIDVVDSISPANDGRIQYHYTLVDMLAVASAEDVPKAGADAADAIWVPIDDLANYKLWYETIRIINQAHEMWQKL